MELLLNGLGDLVSKDTEKAQVTHWQGLFSGLLGSLCLQCLGMSFEEKITTHSGEGLSYGPFKFTC